MVLAKGFLKRFIWSGILFIAAALCITNAHAYHSSLSGSGGNSASHGTTAWQELGTYDSPLSQGVTWSVDGGSNWGNDQLYVGQTVQFKFNMHKNNTGNHYADHLKAWIDWDQNGFAESDMLIYKEEEISATHNFTYISQEVDILDSYVGSNLLRARVTCSESLLNELWDENNWSGNPWRLQWGWDESWRGRTYGTYQEIFKATGYYTQGEVEDYNLLVNAAPVPEPATLILFGFGLIGIAKIGRRKVL